MDKIKVGAFQFEITGSIKHNWEKVRLGIENAISQGVELLVFPECALTGYPPVDIAAPEAVDFDLLDSVYEKILKYTEQNNICIIIGSIRTDGMERFYNSALIFEPYKNTYDFYDKRALWGWDKDNFEKGNKDGIITVKGLRIGIRICYEIRFPEYFRELYKRKTDLNIILFYDTSAQENTERYNIINGHIITRAVENVCHTLTVNTSGNYQTAPTCLVNKSGYVLERSNRNGDCLLTYVLDDFTDDFGEAGRRTISDSLTL